MFFHLQFGVYLSLGNYVCDHLFDGKTMMSFVVVDVISIYSDTTKHFFFYIILGYAVENETYLI